MNVVLQNRIIMENEKKKEDQKRLGTIQKKESKRLETDKKEQPKRLEESEYDTDPPVEFIESDGSRPQTTPDVDGRAADIEKFKTGEKGAEHFRYNDDGPPYGPSRKLDIDTETNPK